MPPAAVSPTVDSGNFQTINGNGKTQTKIQNSDKSTTSISNGNGSTNADVRKITILRDAVQRSVTTYQSELGSSTNDFLNSCTSIDAFFDYVAGIRLRQIPHHSSRWDKAMKWAEFFAAQVYGYSEEAAHFVSYSDRAASIIWACCRSLLELGKDHVAMLEKAFGVFYSCGLTLSFFLRHHELLHQNEELQLILASCYTDLFKLVTGISLYYTRKQSQTNFSIQTFDELFGKNIDSFFAHSDHFTDTIWASRLEILSKSGDVSFSLVRDFLTPHDRITRLLAVTRNLRRTRADFTGEWFDRHLADFMRGGKEILVVSGKPRSGKTFLADWTVDRLQTLHGRRASKVLSHTIDPDLKTELTTLSVVKGLLLQSLQLNVGDNNLYKSLSHAYKLSTIGSPPSQIEDALWAALEAGLGSDSNHTFVIDGIDQLGHGDSDVHKLLDHLNRIATRRSKTKVIVFTRQSSLTANQKYQQFAITTENIRQDIRYFTESLLASVPIFEVLTQNDRPTVTTKLIDNSGGSFEWIVQAVETLKVETTSTGIVKKLDTLARTLETLIDQSISKIDLTQRDSKSLLAWLLVSQRPLLLTEISQLFEIDQNKSVRNPRTTRVEDDVTKALGSLITIRDGFVRFTNPVIKQVLIDRASSVTDFKNKGAFPFHVQEAHYDLTIRSLSYIKAVLTRPTQPTTTPLNDHELDELFDQYDFLQYAARYWSWHFQASPMHEPVVQHKVTETFRNAFPHTTLLAVIEGSCYQYQSTYQQAIDYHLLTLSLRKLILGSDSQPVLQTLLNLALLKEVTLQSTEVNDFYYEAWRVAYTVKLTTIATACANRYIERTSSLKMTSKSTITTRRSEMLEYIITIYKETRASQQQILSYLEMLVTLYVTIGETEKVTRIRKEIYQLNVKIYGRSAPQTLRSHQELVTVVSKSTNTEEIQEITESNYREVSRTLPITDPKRLDLTWSMIDIYTKRNDTNRVEELLIWLWQGWTHHSQTHKDSKSQQQRIDIALRYVQFLKTHNRKAEAENILRGVVTDIDHSQTDDEEIVKRTRVIGDELTSLGSVTAAQGVFSRLWAYYVRTGKTNTTEAKSISTELERTTSGSNTETTTDLALLQEIFDTVIKKDTSKTIDSRTVHTTVTLIESYYREQRWEQVIQVSTVTLTRLWSGWTSTELRVALPSQYFEETITTIRRLFTSYLKLRQTNHAESTLRRLFYGVLATSSTTDELLLTTSKSLIDFYQSHNMIDKSVIIYKDLYTEVERRKGKADILTIKTLYALGDTSMRVNDFKHAEFAYRTIHANLGADICHRDALRAAQTLITIHEQQRQFSTATKVYQSIWQMFLKHGKEYDLKPDWSEDFYEKYVRNLKQDSKIEYSTLRQLAIEYRKALVRFYGVSHESTIKATLDLAELNEEKMEHREEAIGLYEEADQKSREAHKGQISETTLKSITAHRERLPHLYSTSQLSSSPKAIPLYEYQWQTYHTKHGYSHGDAMRWLTFLTVAHTKQSTTESKTKANNVVTTSAVEILKHEKNSQRFWDSGSGLANVYLKAGLKSEGEQLLQQLRGQVIFGDSTLSKSLGLSATSNLDRSTWIFIISFQTTLHGVKSSYTTVMADLINEVFLYNSYRRIITQKAPFLDSLACGSRLLQFMRDIKDEPSHTRVERELLEFFATNLSASKTVNASILREFFEIVLTEIHHHDMDVTTLKTGSSKVVAYANKEKYSEAHDLAFLVDRFQHHIGGYNTLEKVKYALVIALALSNYNKSKVVDARIKSSLLELSSQITKHVVEEVRDGHIPLTDISLEDLNIASGLLGTQENLVDLEYILAKLWNARLTQPNWPAHTIVALGRRLVETQFLRGSHATAIHLCEDMCYNLRRVWGALDATTLDMHVLLSEFYTSSEKYRKAMQVHEDVLRDTVSDKGEELQGSEAAAIAVKHLELLRRSYQRLGGWDKEPQVYVDLYQQLSHVFGSEEKWKKAQIQTIDKWSTKGVDKLGVWYKPETFEWMEREATRKHANYLRRSLGNSHGFAAHFHGGRLTRTYSARSITSK